MLTRNPYLKSSSDALVIEQAVILPPPPHPNPQALISHFQSTIQCKDPEDVLDDEHENEENVGSLHLVEDGEAEAVSDSNNLEILLNEPGGEMIEMQGEEQSAKEEALANTYRQIGSCRKCTFDTSSTVCTDNEFSF